MYNTELTIADLAEVIHDMCPIKILVDNEEIWSDDIDLTNIPEENARETMLANYAQYREALKRTDLVSIISFEITDFHHSIVHITTAKGLE